MDSLRPDLDELNQYKSRTDNNKKSTKSPGAEQNAATVSGSGSSFMLKFIVTILLFGCAGLGYLVWIQQQSITDLNDKVSQADSFINQSKLLMARMEGELTETGEELEQSGSDAKKKLDFLDSEMRKLWGVSNDRNKKSIKENRKNIESLTAKLKSSATARNKLEKKLSSDLSKVTAQQLTLDNRIASISGELSIISSEQTEQMDSITKELGGIKKSGDALNKRLLKVDKEMLVLTQKSASIKPTIESLSEANRQLVQRIIELEKRLDKVAKASVAKAAASSEGPSL